MDALAWEQLLKNHMPLLAGIAYRVASRWGKPDPDDVQEAVQEICMKLSSAARMGRGGTGDDGSIEAFLKALAANAASDYFRSRNAARRTVSGIVVSFDDPDAPAELQPWVRGGSDECLMRRQIDDALLEFSRRDRSVFLLYYRQGWKAKEIAEIPTLGLTLKGVESVLARMTSAMKEKFGKGKASKNA